jgi:hypothetical protein
MKTRYAKPFESVQVEIPYETGMSPYSGLVEFFERAELLKKTGNRLEYTSPVSGEVTTQFRKAWANNEADCLDKIMSDYNEIQVSGEVKQDISEEELNSLDENQPTNEEVNENIE